jgi:hypothetical protein
VLLMQGAGESVPVRIVTAPDASCGGATWSGAIAIIRGRLARRFGEAVTVEHVQAFSTRFFEMPKVTAVIEVGAELPIVLVGEDVVSRGGKLSEPKIAEALRAATLATEGRSER